MSKINLFLLITLPLLSGELLAQETEIVDIAAYNALGEKVDLLEAINRKILNTIYFALGGAGTIVLAIIGLNFFQNFKLNDRKLDAIKAELESVIVKSAQDSTESLENEVKQIRDDLEEEFNEIEKKLDSKLRSRAESLKEKVSDLNEEFVDIQRNILMLEAKSAKEIASYQHYSPLIKVLELDIEKGWDFRINSTLRMISKCLGSYDPSSEQLSKLQLILDELPKDYDFQKKEIQAKMVVK